MNNIFNKLVSLQQNAYIPYSNYPVACILVGDNNENICGVNVENASFGLTICAERNAITTAVTNGIKHFKQVHILCGQAQADFGTPCGACRQVLAEFMNDDDLIFIWNCEGKSKQYKLIELLPDCFRSSFIEKNNKEI